MPSKHVVVIGGGFAGLAAARGLAREAVDITLVDRKNHHVFQPLLYQVATAGLSPAEIASPIRRILRRQGNVRVLLGEAAAVDPGARRVRLDSGELGYDFLILAAGATHSYFGNDAWEPHAPGLKTLEDALEIRRRALLAFERAEREDDEAARRQWLTLVVIGGGPTGVEMAGAFAEIARRSMVREFRRIDPRAARVVLIEAGPRILAAYPEELSHQAQAQLETLGVQVWTGSAVTGLGAGFVQVGDDRLAARTIVWAAGVHGAPLAASLGVELDKAGRVRVQPDLSVPGHPELLVAGDLVSLQQDGRLVPGVAPAAMQMGAHAAANVARALRGEPLLPFRYRDKGSLATIGRRRAVALVGALRLSGLVAWLAWLGIHIFFLIGFRNRFVVLFDWAWAYLTYDRAARLILDRARDSAAAREAEFLEAAAVPFDASHASGTLERAEAMLAAHPELADSSIQAAATLGDADGVQRFLARDASSATATGGPRGWDALTHLCFSRYLRLDPSRSSGFVRAAKALLDAGADPNGGFTHDGERESVLYGAAGVAHHPGLTRLLLERGADPNDGEVVYHAPESQDNVVMKLLVETGRLTADSLTVLLVRKHDWHDLEGVTWLLEHGADPNRVSRWGKCAIHQAVLRDNALVFFERLLDKGADPGVAWQGLSAVAMAARAGRGDVLELFEARGRGERLAGAPRLLAACARNDAAAVRAIAASEPGAVAEVVADAGELLAEFAGVGNTEGVRLLLELGAPVDAPFAQGDGYFDIAKGATALHVAAWRAWPATLRLLLERGASVRARDGKGRTPLQLAVRACVDSYWTHRRSPESVEALLRAGASASEVRLPTGYPAVDELLRAHPSPPPA